ncbi:YicC/YloC family endoribonuclease [Pseudohongiella sp.]|uniref:YicC family protein n=1 Tax=marine sediment metagenome TaxID=412755 RepID=A0A0F9YAB7_9ZZZZ|nr:YicC/YloC family endoribonuclease [Pseudohongiella sp.]HDZ08071.1 YicC family protein [Pseudohongiella sp.]HEA64086.1 YicC family protein [Pseudohongiella sp.]
MVASMTAFARRQAEYDWGTLVWEIRSVNHRYLEPGIRIPDMLKPIEPAVRDALRKSISRGKVDCQLRFQIRQKDAGNEELNLTLVKKLTQLSQQVTALNAASAPLSAADILRWPGALQEQEIDTDAMQGDALVLLADTLNDFTASRLREGDELRQMIQQRLNGIRVIVQSVRERLPHILAKQQEATRAKLAAFRIELEPSRLEQEVVLLAQKSDVDEELDRLNTHLTEVERVLGTDEPIGRRLDFLMQELNREANTLSSKSIVAETTLNAVELKVLIEQMREQIQNIE